MEATRPGAGQQEPPPSAPVLPARLRTAGKHKELATVEALGTDTRTWTAEIEDAAHFASFRRPDRFLDLVPAKVRPVVVEGRELATRL
ncbi:hypothetical protein [Kitasatospora purpeofusca]|uniref:hypothetical protein n=1 Tax=Kitasatospora purpeofusca TaxID=67352 RepID=UPI003F4A96CB